MIIGRLASKLRTLTGKLHSDKKMTIGNSMPRYINLRNDAETLLNLQSGVNDTIVAANWLLIQLSHRRSSRRAIRLFSP